MSSSNPVNLYNLDTRYATPSQIDAKITAQASTDANSYATQASLALKANSGAQQPSLSVTSWATNTTYVKGQLVLSPVGAVMPNATSLLQAVSSFTSGASFSLSNWIQLSDIGLPIGTASGTVAAGNDARITTAAANTSAIAALSLTPTSVKTTNYTANIQELVLVNASSASFIVTLPTTPVEGALIEVKKLDASTNTVTIATGGADTYITGGTAMTLALQGHAVTLRYQVATAMWITLNNDLPLSAIDARYASSNYVVPPVRVSRSTSQGIATGAEITVSFDTEQFDAEDWHKAATPTRLICPTGRGGKYIVAGACDFDGNTSGVTRAVSIRKNNVKIVEAVVSSPNNHQAIQVFDFVSLVPGDYVELFAYSAGGANVQVNYFQPWIGATFISL